MKNRIEEEKKKIRSKNLREVIDTLEGGFEHASRLSLKTVKTLQKYAQPSHGISHKVARDLELKLRLPGGYLDEASREKKHVYYVMLTVADSETYDIVNWLSENTTEVLECSALLGEFDIFVKVEVPNFHYLEEFFAKLTRLPKVIRTRTFAAVDSIRWQREQIGYNEVKDPVPNKRLPDIVVKTRVDDHIRQIKELERGRIVAYDNSEHRIRLLDVLEDSRDTYRAIREYKEEIYEYDRYLSTEAEKIKQGVTTLRIFMVPKSLNEGELEEVLTEAKRVVDIGGKVRILSEDKWVKRGDNRKPECFSVVDSLYVCVKKKAEERTVLHKDKDRVAMYLRTWESNWERATPFEYFHKST